MTKSIFENLNDQTKQANQFANCVPTGMSKWLCDTVRLLERQTPRNDCADPMDRPHRLKCNGDILREEALIRHAFDQVAGRGVVFPVIEDVFYPELRARTEGDGVSQDADELLLG